MTKPKDAKKSRWSSRNVLIAMGAGIAGTCLCLILVVGGVGGRETPTPTLAPALPTGIQLNAPTLAATATIREQVITLTPRPATPVAPITSTALSSTAAPTNTPLASATRPTGITFTPAPALPMSTPAPVIAPTDTPVPAPTNYDRNGDGKVTCADFSTQAEAQAAYNAGYTNLDGNDNDGLACESLP